MRSGAPLAVLTTHITLIVLVIAAVATTALPLPARVAVAALLAAPLALALRGLRRGDPYTCSWLAIVLVLYVGAAVIEVIAAPTRAYLPPLALLAAFADLGLVLMLGRRLRARALRE